METATRYAPVVFRCGSCGDAHRYRIQLPAPPTLDLRCPETLVGIRLNTAVAMERQRAGRPIATRLPDGRTRQTWHGPMTTEITAGLIHRREVRRGLMRALPRSAWEEERGLLDSAFFIRIPEGRDFALTLPA